MTKFTGPLYIGDWSTDTTAVTIDASGTAIFTGPIRDRGNRGQVTYSRETTLVALNSAANPATLILPSGSNVLDIYINVEIPFDAGTLVTASRVLVSAVGGSTLAEITISASTVAYRLGLGNVTTYGGRAHRNVTTTLEAHVSTQALASGVTVGQAIWGVVYVQNL